MYRFQEESFPNVLSRNDWYDSKLFCVQGKPNSKISYNTHLSSVSQAFKEAGIVSRKKTHATRGSSVRKSEAAGVEENQLRRAGRWNSDAMNQSYLTNIPMQAVRASAGFNPTIGSYYTARSCLNVPTNLKIQIFPEIEQYKNDLSARNSNDISAIGFLETMEWAREVLLQDIPLLHLPPNSIIFQYRPFNSEDYMQWADSVRSYHQSNFEEQSHDERLSAVVPVIDQKLNKISGQVTNILEVLNQNNGPRSGGSLHQTAINQLSMLQNATFTLSRQTSTVQELYDEWYIGSESKPSLEEFERFCGHNWRSGQKERKFFSNRKKIIDEIKRRENAGVSIAAAILELETIRDGKSLDVLRKKILQLNRERSI